MASAAPGVRYPNVYGIDMPSATELIAHGRSDEEVGEIIGADWIVYQDIEDLVLAAAEGNEQIQRFECSVFDGNYITGDVDDAYLQRIDQARNDSAKLKPANANGQRKTQVLGLHNNKNAASA